MPEWTVGLLCHDLIILKSKISLFLRQNSGRFRAGQYSKGLTSCELIGHHRYGKVLMKKVEEEAIMSNRPPNVRPPVLEH